MTTDQILNDLINSLKTIDSKDIPNIDLYMDQVTTFMDSNLSFYKRTEDEKILTKTMINNYAKTSLLPSPEKKKYTKDHMLILILIYYLKNVLSITDIEKVMKPVSEDYFGGKEDIKVTEIYDFLMSHADTFATDAKEDILNKTSLMSDSALMAKTASMDDGDTRTKELENFLTILALTYDITIKKQLIEKIIDSMDTPKKDNKSEEKEKK